MVMGDALRLGLYSHLFPIPGPLWRSVARMQARGVARRFRALSPDHVRVRAWVVAELARRPGAIGPTRIAAALAIPIDRVQAILAELEARLVFLFRDPSGSVEWACPATAARTAHRVDLGGPEPAWAA